MLFATVIRQTLRIWSRVRFFEVHSCAVCAIATCFGESTIHWQYTSRKHTDISSNFVCRITISKIVKNFWIQQLFDDNLENLLQAPRNVSETRSQFDLGATSKALFEMFKRRNNALVVRRNGLCDIPRHCKIWVLLTG